MAQIKNVDITPGGIQSQVINVSQDDVGREVVINVKDGSGQYDLTGCSVKLAGLKPSGLGFSVDGVVDGHKVTITTTKQMTDEYGQIACELQIIDGDDNKIGTANMILAVEKNPHPDHTTDGSVDELIPEITALVERAEAAVAKGEDAEAWAVGQRSGVDVDSDDPTYHNNAKYYCEQTEASETAAANSAASALDSRTSAAGSAASASVAQARAAASEADAEDAATRAEGAAASAAAVFTIAGDASFSVDEDNDLWLNITINE